MTSSLRERLAGKLMVNLIFRIATICICLLQMDALWGGLQRHWGDLSHSEQREAIMILVMYSLPCLNFFKVSKEPIFNALLLFMTYSLLGAATGVIFR